MVSRRTLGSEGSIYCDICGFPVGSRPYRALLDGVEVTLCPSCFSKLSRSGRAKLVKDKPPARPVAPKIRRRRRSLEIYELVEDYPQRIQSGRSRLGMSRSDLAAKLRISESLLRSIEQGRFKPDINLARKLEKMLGIKLLEPLEEDYWDEEYEPPTDAPTLGDIVVIRRDED